jgi:hypothetical protein
MITVSFIIVESTVPKGSVGAHYRSDHKDRGIRWQNI